MPVRYVAGDLFANRHNVAAFGHGCNCRGVMGSGIAAQFKKHYPAMFEAYRDMCKANPREFNPGDAFLWQADDAPDVFNLATQDGYGGFRPAKLEWVMAALQEMRQQADEVGIMSIAIPAIGSGLGGLRWDNVRATIDAEFTDWEGVLVV
ncbi:MAG: macro domain-containing protein, partial [Chloroflexota bacterium]